MGRYRLRVLDETAQESPIAMAVINGEYWAPGFACMACGANLTNKSCSGSHPNAAEHGWYCQTGCYHKHGYGLKVRLRREKRECILAKTADTLCTLDGLLPDTPAASAAWDVLNKLHKRLQSRGW